MSIAEKIKPIKSMPKVLSMLVYGRSGTGKTRFSSTFPTPALLIDVREKGWDSIAHVPGIEILQLDTWSELEEIYWYIKKEGAGKYKTVIIDQITQLQDLCMEHVMEEEKKEIMSQRLWGNLSGLMKTWLLNYRDLVDEGTNVIFLAHDRVSKDEGNDDESIDPQVGARLMPSLAAFVNGAMKVIGNTFVREVFLEDKTRKVEYCMRIGAHAYYTTKVRTDDKTEIPNFITDPTYADIMKLMVGQEASPPVIKQPLRRKVNG